MTSLYPTLGPDPLGLERGEKKEHESEIGAVDENASEEREGVQFFFFCREKTSRIQNECMKSRVCG